MNNRRWLWLIVVVLLAGTLACSSEKSTPLTPATPVPTTAAPEVATPRPTKTPTQATAEPPAAATPKPKPTERPTQATGTTLEILNESGAELGELFISSVDDDSWGANWLSESIPAGGSTTIQGLEEGSYDLKVTYGDGSTAEVLYNAYIGDPTTWTVVGTASLPDNAVLRFEDDFTDNRNSWGEDFGDDVDYYAPADGQYCINVKVSNMTAWEWYEPFRTDDFFAEVQCEVSADTDASCGLGFGPDGDNLFWYEVDATSQSYAVFLLQDDTWQDPLIDWTENLHINPNGINYLALGRTDGTLFVYINGVLLQQTDTALFPTGRIGIGGATYDDAPVTLCLDNLMVWRIEK